MVSNTWKLQDAKARFSELVRKARGGEPQTVTVHGEPAVVITAVKKPRPAKQDAGRTPGFNDRSEDYREPETDVPPPKKIMTTAEFLERSKKYRGLAEGIDFEPDLRMPFRDKRLEIFDADLFDESKR